MQTQAINSGMNQGEISARARKAYDVAHEFESLFASFMLRAMRKTTGNNPLFPMSTGERIYTDMLDSEYAKLLSSNGSFGLADMILDQLQKNGEDMPGIEILRALKKSESDYTAAPIGYYSAADENQSALERIGAWKNHIEEAGEIYGLDTNLIAAVIVQESGGNPYAVSPKGAKGLMQLMDTTAREMGVNQVFQPRQNILGGARYLRQMLDQFNGDEQLALASYNAGPGAVRRYNGIPPYRETMEYVQRVLAVRDRLAEPVDTDQSKE
jgi:soluble lytic murein transglycosylase-like protein